MPNFSTMGYKWGSATPGTSGGIVTWAVDASMSSSFVATIKTALTDWALVSDITFKQVSSLASAQLDFVMTAIDGPAGDVATGGATAALYGNPINIETAAQVTFDTGDIRADGTYASANQPAANSLYVVALHEIGHAIGLGHYTGAPALMDGSVNTYAYKTLQPSDIEGARFLYGVRDEAPVFRFLDQKTGNHVYTSSADEQSAIRQTMAGMTFEGSLWSAPAKSGETTDVFRFLDTKTGTQFLTTDSHERDVLRQAHPEFTDEGVAFQAYTDASHEGALALDRFFNTATGQHHLAASAAESAGLRAGAAGADWVYEGAGLVVHQPVDALIV